MNDKPKIYVYCPTKDSRDCAGVAFAEDGTELVADAMSVFAGKPPEPRPDAVVSRVGMRGLRGSAVDSLLPSLQYAIDKFQTLA